MLSRDEQQNFQTHLSSWLDFSNAASREDAQQDDTDPRKAFISIAERIAELYTELGYEKPQIIPCSGPIEQIIFPGLVGMMLKLGREAAKEPQFLRVSGMESGLEAAKWRSFWRIAYNSIDWSRETSFDLSLESLLNSQIDVRIGRRVKSNLEAYVDLELGFEEHQIFELMCERFLETPCTRIRSALSFNATETTSTWKSFMTRLPALSRKH